jgi:hypothetical protein
MPDGEDDQLIALHAVVQEVANTAEVEPADTGEAGVTERRTHTRLAKEEFERRLQILP